MLIELGSNLFQIQNIEEIKDGEIKVILFFKFIKKIGSHVNS